MHYLHKITNYNIMKRSDHSGKNFFKVTYNDDVVSYSNLCSKVPDSGPFCFPDVFLMSNSYLSLLQPVQYPIWHLSLYK